MMRSHWCAQCNLCTRLSPEHGDEGRDLHGPAPILLHAFRRAVVGQCSWQGAGWLHRRSFCIHGLRNDTMAYLILTTELRTIEVSRARIEHLQKHVLSEKRKLWVHGKRRGSADKSVQVLWEVYERIQSYVALRPGPLKGSDPLFATTACYNRGGNVVTAPTFSQFFALHRPCCRCST